MTEKRLEDLKRFYSIMERLSHFIGGAKRLSDCDGRMPWPVRGVYFFFEDGQERRDSGGGPRVVRVGTHALKAGSKTTLWNRLSQHRGVQRTSGGNHRGSVFRKHIGATLLHRDVGLSCPTWGNGTGASAEIRRQEHHLEVMVSEVIRSMPFLWLGIDDPASPRSERGYIEQNSIALLSNFNKPALDPSTPKWLGRSCTSQRVRESGLWNSNHVDEGYDIAFLDRLEAWLPG